MSQKPTVEAVGVESPTSSQLRKEDEFRSRIRQSLTRKQDEVRQEFIGVLEELTKPINERIPPADEAARSDDDRRDSQENWNKRQSAFAYGDVRDMQDYLYASLPKFAQRIRNPRSDKMMADFLKGVRWKNWEVVDRTSRQLNGMFGLQRELLEGESELESGGTPGTGSPFLPLPLANLIVLHRDARAKVRGVATRFTSNSQSLRIPVAASSLSDAAMVGEGSTATEATPQLTSKLLQKRKGQARFAASDEMLEDSAFNLVTFFAERGGSALGALEDIQFCRAAQTDPNISESLEQASITAVAEATSGVLTYQDVVKLFFAVPEQYRTSGLIWMGNAFMMQLLSSLLDLNGRPVFAPGFSAPLVTTSEAPPQGTVGSIFGHPVLELPFTEGSSPQSADLWIGMMSNYAYLDGGGITVRASEHSRWAEDMVEWKITERFDGSVMLEDSFRNMEGITQVA